MAAPEDFAHRLLLAVTGLSPQVVTETVWAIARQTPAAVPTKIRLLTTAEGAHRARLLLKGTSNQPGALASLANCLGVPTWPLDIVPICGADGAPLDDLASEADNTAAADAIVNAVRQATSDAEAAVHVSIAGGRKTMGFLAGMALSLFGREQDRLSHVLVSAPFQGHAAFFFPPATPRVLIAADGRPVSTEEAHVVLTDIPFLRLRHGFSAAELSRPGGYAAAIAAAQTRLAPPRLLLDLPAGRAVLGETVLLLSQSLLGGMLWFARHRLRGDGSVNWLDGNAATWVQAAIDASGSSDSATAQRAAKAVQKGLSAELLAEKKARLNQRIRTAMGAAARFYLVETIGRRPTSRYRLATPPEAITIVTTDGRRETTQ